MWVIANVGERRICRLKSVNLILPKSKLYACHVICTVITVHFFLKMHSHILTMQTQNILKVKFE